MEGSRKGVFLPSASLDSGLIISCLQALHSDYPSIKFSSICSDEKLGGFKVCFSDLNGTAVLERRQLMTSDKEIFIYPLTAYFLVNGMHSKKTPHYERDVRDAILRKLGKVLSLKNNSSNEWLVEIEIPEFSGLEVFERHIHSQLTVSLPNRNETLKLEFWCKHCNRSGHFRHECGKFSPVTSKDAESTSRSGEKNSTQPNTADSSQPANGRTNFPFEPRLEPTNVYAEKIGREEIMKSMNDKQDKAAAGSARYAATTGNNSLLEEKHIKKETDESKDENHFKVGKKSYFPRSDQYNRDESNDSEKAAVGSDSHDDDIQIITEAPNKKRPTNLASPDSNSTFKAEGENSVAPSRSESSNFPSKSLFDSSSYATPGPSSETFSSPRPARGAEVTTILSERLQESINEACSSVGVLERQKLDAFLIHVKKKSNPIRVALNYTQNAKGLKEQLKKILFIYYNTPQTGTKEDIQFIKWLNGLVERFDGSIPRKRKRAGQSNDDDDEPVRKMK